MNDHRKKQDEICFGLLEVIQILEFLCLLASPIIIFFLCYIRHTNNGYSGYRDDLSQALLLIDYLNWSVWTLAMAVIAVSRFFSNLVKKIQESPGSGEHE